MKLDGSRMSTRRYVMLLDDASIRKMWSSKNGLRISTLTLGIQKRRFIAPSGRSEAIGLGPV